jgi:hypothetical protein
MCEYKRTFREQSHLHSEFKSVRDNRVKADSNSKKEVLSGIDHINQDGVSYVFLDHINPELRMLPSGPESITSTRVFLSRIELALEESRIYKYNTAGPELPLFSLVLDPLIAALGVISSPRWKLHLQIGPSCLRIYCAAYSSCISVRTTSELPPSARRGTRRPPRSAASARPPVYSIAPRPPAQALSACTASRSKGRTRSPCQTRQWPGDS